MIDLQDGVTVQVIEPTELQITVVQPDQVSLTEVGPALVIGGAAAQVFTQASPSASWGPFTHNLGRRPIVTIYDAAGAEVDADVDADNSTVTITTAAPSTGSVVLI